VVAGERAPVEQREGDFGPSSSATATARLSATIGDGSSRVSWSYSATTWDQSVSEAVGASVWTALIAASIW
jgi:hypothetical protein